MEQVRKHQEKMVDKEYKREELDRQHEKEKEQLKGQYE